MPNRSGDGDRRIEGTPNRNVSHNNRRATAFDSELAVLDALDVRRVAVGVSSNSDISPGSGLDKIDNTDKPKTDFIDLDDLTDTALGFDFGPVILGGLDPTVDNTITTQATFNDGTVLEVDNTITGALPI